MTAARALIVADGHAMWHDGILHTDGNLFAYHRFIRNERTATFVHLPNPNVIRVEVERADAR